MASNSHSPLAGGDRMGPIPNTAQLCPSGKTAPVTIIAKSLAASAEGKTSPLRRLTSDDTRILSSRVG
jgi:hypothetical protein